MALSSGKSGRFYQLCLVAGVVKPSICFWVFRKGVFSFLARSCLNVPGPSITP